MNKTNTENLPDLSELESNENDDKTEGTRKEFAKTGLRRKLKSQAGAGTISDPRRALNNESARRRLPDK